MSLVPDGLHGMLRVGRSLIPGAGLGLFATECVAANELLLAYGGRTITGSQLAGALSAGETTGDYAVRVRRDLYIDAEHTPQHLARYINDARGSPLRNNVEFVRVPSPGRLGGVELHLQTTRHVAAGHELLVSYGEPYWQMWYQRNSVL